MFVSEVFGQLILQGNPPHQLAVVSSQLNPFFTPSDRVHTAAFEEEEMVCRFQLHCFLIALIFLQFCKITSQS